MALPVLKEVPDTVSSVDQIAFAGNNSSFLIIGITDYVADLCKADPDTGPVLVSETFLNIVLFKEGIGDISKIGRSSEVIILLIFESLYTRMH